MKTLVPPGKGRAFEYLMNTMTKPDELFGPYSLRSLSECVGPSALEAAATMGTAVRAVLNATGTTGCRRD